MTATTVEHPPAVMQCMEIRGGNEAVEARVATPGLDLWVRSEPYAGALNGGDVHYVSLCGGGVITRMIIADVSGHGAAVAEVARDLRTLMRRHINSKRQDRLVRELNRQFAQLAQMRRFATAIVATYLATTRRLTVCNAGHPRPLIRRAATGQWLPLDAPIAPEGEETAHSNLPLGIDEASDYRQFAIDLVEGDIVLIHTDALIEARGPDGRQLGEEGLLELLRNGRSHDPATIARELPLAISDHRKQMPAEDDLTFLLFRCNANPPSRLSLRQKVDVYARFFGLKPV